MKGNGSNSECSKTSLTNSQNDEGSSESGENNDDDHQVNKPTSSNNNNGGLSSSNSTVEENEKKSSSVRPYVRSRCQGFGGHQIFITALSMLWRGSVDKRVSTNSIFIYFIWHTYFFLYFSIILVENFPFCIVNMICGEILLYFVLQFDDIGAHEI